jgi:AraC-like DNA-binding protein/quercetin dioxygenase-like cupin family protein
LSRDTISNMATRTVLEGAALRGVPGVRMLGHYRYAAAGAALRPHSHPGALEICLLLSGRQAYRAGGRTYRLKGGDQFVTWPGETHDTAGLPEEKGELMWLIVDLPKRGGGFLFLSPGATARLAAALRRLPTRHFRAARHAAASLHAAFAALRDKGAPLAPLRAAQALVASLLETVAAARTGAVPAVSPRIAAALAYADGQIDRWIPVPELAERSGLSVPRFKARFRAEVGMPPGEYMLRRKIDAARERLARPDASVTGVALDLGFSSSQYFATAFRRYTLKTPSAFLRKGFQRKRKGLGLGGLDAFHDNRGAEAAESVN